MGQTAEGPIKDKSLAGTPEGPGMRLPPQCPGGSERRAKVCVHSAPERNPSSKSMEREIPRVYGSTGSLSRGQFSPADAHIQSILDQGQAFGVVAKMTLGMSHPM